MFAPGNGLAGLQRQRAGGRHAHRHPLYRPVEAVADPRHGGDAGLAGRIQRLAQLAHGSGQHVIHGDAPGPDRIEQLVLGHNLAGMAQQQRQHFQRLVFDVHRKPGHPQLPAGLVEFDRAEAPAIELNVHVVCRISPGPR